jgi:hypothetical protein
LTCVRLRYPRAPRHGAAAAALVVALLAGCGGGSGDTGSSDVGVTTAGTDTVSATVAPAPPPAAPTAGAARSDESLIRGAISAVFASGDPAAACEKYATPAYVASAYGDLSGCRAAQQAGAAANGVTTTGVLVSGDSAKAVAVPSGGPSDGEKIELTLVKDGAIWKVDSARANVPVGP